MKILLVDDEIVALEALAKNVDWMKYGFTEVFTASDADHVRSLFEKERIDLMLCDIEMPGESGLELTEFVKEHYLETECIIITCHARFEYIKKAMKYHVMDYILKPIDFDELEGLLEQFHDQRSEKDDKKNLEKIAQKAMLAHEPEPDNPRERLAAVKEYINDHLHEKIYVEDLASLIPLNPQHFMRVFKRYTGQSVTEYITERRIITASSMLKNTDYPINFIADCVGCENSSYFTTLFKKYSGFTPKEYRAMFKGKI